MTPRVAVRHGGARGAGGSATRPEPGASPLDEPRDRSPREQERTPDSPEVDEPARGPQPVAISEREPESSSARPPPTSEPGEGTGAVGAGRWGFLPAHTREVFRARHTEEVPVKYRDWIDAYYRRLARPQG